MTTNYKECSLEELNDIMKFIDRDEFPDRFQELKQEIESRKQQLSEPQSEHIEMQHFDANEQFSKCPYCSEPLSHWSLLMKSHKSDSQCPHCGNLLGRGVNYKFMVMLFFVSIIVHFVLLRPVVINLGGAPALSIALLVVVSTMLSARWKRVHKIDNIS